MANPEHVERLKQGVQEWNAWRQEHPDIQPDLSGADLHGINLIYADLNKVILVETNLSEANLQFANLSDGDLRKASFYRANLSDATLHRTNLTETDFRSTRLYFTDFSDATFHMTNLTHASLWATSFGNVDLRQVDGLETLRHRGRSYVDIHTLSRSQGDIPETFLQGIGASDDAIAYMHTFFLHPIQYHSCFISYSSKDETLARRLYQDLQNKGVRCWMAPHDLRPGDYHHMRIDEAIHLHEKTLLLLSEHAVNSSWVKHEVQVALAREIDQDCTVLFPLRLDEAIMQTDKDWAFRLRKARHIGDFTNWQDEAIYNQAFTALLKHLKIDKTPPA